MTRTDVLLRTAWIGLALVGVFFVLAPVLAIVNTHSAGVPAAHAPTLRRLAGTDIGGVRTSSPGVARYVSTLEYGYALHEMTLGLLFLGVVLFGLRRRNRWAWFACWAVMVAAVGSSLMFGARGRAFPGPGLVADVAVPLFLALAAPAVFRAARPAARPPSRPTPRPVSRPGTRPTPPPVEFIGLGW